MWLDRLAGGAPPNNSGSSTPGSRSYSPLPHKASSSLSPYVTSRRPGHSPRTSSLSLVSNESCASLLSSRRPNGSPLLQRSAIADVPKLLDRLEQLLGAQSVEGVACLPAIGVVEEDVHFDVDFCGLALKDLPASARGAADSEMSRRPQGPDGRDRDRSNLGHLRRSIVACDDVLNSVETNLARFRNDLATVSTDIESLQLRSDGLSRRLDNRIEMEKILGPPVEELSISPEIVSKISEGQIDELWIKSLSEIDKKASASRQKMSSGAFRHEADEKMWPLIEKLVQRAIERIRDFLVSQIKALRCPNINAQIVQQQNFLRFKDLFSFLHKHNAKLGGEISLAYMNTMRWYYVTQFNRYEKALMKIRLHALDRNDTLGHEEATRMAVMLSSSRVAGPSNDAFNLGRRLDLLKAKNTALSSYLAEEDQSAHYLEVPFRSFNIALIDNATSEYTFLASFFRPPLPLSQICKIFNYIFEPTFELGRTLSRSLVGDTFDALGILMCIRLNQQFAFELQRRKVPAVDSYINATNMLLWPRLQVVMDRHCESLRQMTSSPASGTTRVSGNQASSMTAAPHVVTQRFGQLLHGCLALSAEAGDEEPLVASLKRLRSEFEMFLNRQSQLYGADQRKSHRFLYNNLSLVLTIMGDAHGKWAAEHIRHFEQLRRAHEEPSHQ